MPFKPVDKRLENQEYIEKYGTWFEYVQGMMKAETPEELDRYRNLIEHHEKNL